MFFAFEGLVRHDPTRTGPGSNLSYAVETTPPCLSRKGGFPEAYPLLYTEHVIALICTLVSLSAHSHLIHLHNICFSCLLFLDGTQKGGIRGSAVRPAPTSAMATVSRSLHRGISVTIRVSHNFFYLFS